VISRRARSWVPLAMLAAATVSGAGLGLAQAPTAAVGSTTGPGHPSASVAAPSPKVVVPSTGLVGGQRLQVTLRGFPPGASVRIFECTSPVSAATVTGWCGSVSATFVTTGSDGSASGTFIAQPAAASTGSRTTTPCRDECVLVAAVIKNEASSRPSGPTTATTPLSFSTTEAPSLADAFLRDLSWVSATEGWALVAQPCTAGACARLAQTTDGGRSWQALHNPPTQLQEGAADCSTVACVRGVRFATPEVGYLFGPALLMTTDGGRSWQAQPGLQTETLTVANDAVYRVAYQHGGCPGPCQPILQEAAVGSATWHTLIGQLTYPDRSGTAQIVASGSDLLVALYGSQAGPMPATADLYRSTDGGAAWARETDPCSARGAALTTQEEDLIALASAPGGFFAGLCTPHAGTGGDFVVTSADGGGSWQSGGTLPAVEGLGLVAAASPTTLAVSTGPMSGSGPFTAELFVSTDGGLHWTTAATDHHELVPQAGPSGWLGFETAQVGRWVSGPRAIWTTHDGGRSWTRMAFP